MKVKYTPPGTFDWGDKKPQKPRKELTISDLIPNEQDGQELHRRAVAYIMRFLVSQFSDLSRLRHLAPAPHSPHPATKSVVAPMPILALDEKYTAANIQILDALRADTGLSDRPQVEKTVFLLVLSSLNSLTKHLKQHIIGGYW